jgi:hypothetical protein
VHRSQFRLRIATTCAGDPDSLTQVRTQISLCLVSLFLMPAVVRRRPPLSLHEENVSDRDCALYSDSSLVMAEQSVHDVVNQTLSAGDHLSADAYEDTSIRYSTGGDVTVGEARTQIYEGERSDQDGRPHQSGSASFSMANGQSHVGVYLPLSSHLCIECI